MTISPSVFVYGKEGIGWSIDADRDHTIKLLSEAGFKLTQNPFAADVVHFVWWDQVYKFRHLRRFSRAKWLATITNTIDDDSDRFFGLQNVIDVWVAANNNQFEWLSRKGVNVGYQPFYVDETIFRPLDGSRKTLAEDLGINHSLINGKVLIGFFQRDTTADLVEPKWQKDPKFFLEILKGINLTKEQWCLVLAGPRRHWIVDQCDRHNIPYIFIGSLPQKGKDDIDVNNNSSETMAKLYNFVDVSVVSSRREGGPKAVIESIFCGTPVISRPVGFAPDFISPEGLYSSAAEGAQKLSHLICDIGARKELSISNSNKALPQLGRANTIERWVRIYNNLLSSLD